MNSVKKESADPGMRPHPARCQRGHAGFTLVEMLAVMGIILLLTSVMLVSMRGLGGSKSRRVAVSALMGIFDQARMLAISDGRPTYVVFASMPKNQTQDASALPDTMWGRTYALFEDPIITDGTTNFAPVQRSAWTYLPAGVAFKCDSSSDNTPPNVTAALPASGDATQFTMQSRTSNKVANLTLPYIKFDSMGQIIDYNGNIVDASSPCLRVLLFEGSASGSSVELYTNRAAINSTNGNKFALDEILLKPTTGRAAYTLDAANNLASNTP